MYKSSIRAVTFQHSMDRAVKRMGQLEAAVTVFPDDFVKMGMLIHIGGRRVGTIGKWDVKAPKSGEAIEKQVHYETPTWRFSAIYEVSLAAIGTSAEGVQGAEPGPPKKPR